MKIASFEKSSEGRRVLTCPDLDLRPGVVTALIGANGSGKSTLTRILMGSYDLVILDEPTAAMDMESTLAAEELMVDYAQKRQAAVLLITHNLQQARRVAEEAIFLSRGVLVEQGPAATVLEHPTQEETRRFLEFYG